MRVTLAGTLLYCMVVASGSVAQTAEFKCPAVGNEFKYETSSGGPRKYISQGMNGNNCGYVIASGGQPFQIPFGLLFLSLVPDERTALKDLWPLKVGRTVHTSFDLVQRDTKNLFKNTDGTPLIGDDGKTFFWLHQMTVDVQAFLKLKVPYSTLEVFRIEFRKRMETNSKDTADMECITERPLGLIAPCEKIQETVTRIWYSPELAAVVKADIAVGKSTFTYTLDTVQ